MLKGIVESEATPGLFYLADWAFTRITGTNELGIRALSVVCGVALIPTVYVLGHWMAGRWAGLILAAIATLHPLLVWYSADGRSYSALVLLSTLSWIAFGRALDQPSTDRALVWAALGCLIISMHYFGAFFVVGQFVWLFAVRAPLRRPLFVAGFAIAAVGAAAAPTWAVQTPENRLTPFGLMPITLRLADAARMAVSGVSPPTWSLDLPALLVLVAALACLAAARRPDVAGRAAHLGGAALVGFALALIVGRHFLIGRNVIGAWPVVAAVAAAGIALAPARPRLVLAIVSLMLVAGVTAALLVDPRLQKPDWAEAAAVVGPKRDDLAVLVVGGFYAGAMTAYIDAPAIGEVSAREIIAVGSRAPRGRRGCYNGPMCSVTPAEPVDEPLPGLRLVARHNVGLWRIARYRADEPVVVSTANAGQFFYSPHWFEPPAIYQPASDGGA